MAIKIGYQPRKQRRFRFRAPLHVRHKLVAAHVSKDLQKEVVRVDLRRYKVFVEGVQRQNAKGQDVMIPLDPSNLLIIEVDTSDERRFS